MYRYGKYHKHYWPYTARKFRGSTTGSYGSVCDDTEAERLSEWTETYKHQTSRVILIPLYSLNSILLLINPDHSRYCGCGTGWQALGFHHICPYWYHCHTATAYNKQASSVIIRPPVDVLKCIFEVAVLESSSVIEEGLRLHTATAISHEWRSIAIMVMYEVPAARPHPRCPLLFGSHDGLNKGNSCRIRYI